jgi:hypothetical protein
VVIDRIGGLTIDTPITNIHGLFDIPKNCYNVSDTFMFDYPIDSILFLSLPSGPFV